MVANPHTYYRSLIASAFPYLAISLNLKAGNFFDVVV